MNTTIRRRRTIVPPQVATLFAISVFLSIAFPARALALCGDRGSAPCPGTLLTTYFDTSEPASQNGSGVGDNLVELINPVGCAHPNVCENQTANLCAMIYVFDNIEDMGECCGCPLSPQKLLSLSVEKDLRSNWGLTGPLPGSGVIEIISANPNVSSCSSNGCNGGCDAAVAYKAARELNGYSLHDQAVPSANSSTTLGISEVSLADAGDTPPRTLTTLIATCAARLSVGSIGSCSCGAVGSDGSSRSSSRVVSK